jgi:hypothetical protein
MIPPRLVCSLMAMIMGWPCNGLTQELVDDVRRSILVNARVEGEFGVVAIHNG